MVTYHIRLVGWNSVAVVTGTVPFRERWTRQIDDSRGETADGVETERYLKQTQNEP